MEQGSMNAIGLVLNMIGVIIIFFWGPPMPNFEEGVALGLAEKTPITPNGKTVEEHDKELKCKRNIHVIMSRLGLIIIFIGFGLQLSATFQLVV